MNERNTKLYSFLKKCEIPPNESYFWLVLNILFNVFLVLLGRCLMQIIDSGNKQDSQYVLMSTKNIGDLPLLYRNLDELKNENNFSDVTIIADKMFIKPLQALEINNFKIVPFWVIMALDKIVQLYPDKYSNIIMSQPWYFFFFFFINTNALFRSLPNHISIETIQKLFVRPEMHGKSVILSPYEQTASIYGLELLPLDFWNKLALRLKQKGFFVFTNCNGKTEKPIGGTIVFFPKMGELAGAVEYAGYCVSMRSGFADWISSANLKREVLLYPTRRYFEYYSIKMLWGKDSVLEFIYGESNKNNDEIVEMIVEYFSNEDDIA